MGTASVIIVILLCALIGLGAALAHFLFIGPDWEGE